LQLGSFDVKVRVEPSLAQLQRLASWLPKHAGSVRSLSISLEYDAVCAREYKKEQVYELLRRAEELLLQALQPSQQSQAAEPAAAAAEELQALAQEAAATAADAPASSETAADDLSDLLAAAAIAEAAAPSAAAAGALRLTSFSSNCITAAGAGVLLLLLPAHTLTRLELRGFVQQPDVSAESNAWCAGLARLTNLQHLQLELDRPLIVGQLVYGTELDELEHLDSSIAEACLAGIAEVSRLTSLDLSIRVYDAWGLDRVCTWRLAC
jgi:hypothetical protein